jgi:Zn-dependent protease
MFERAWHIGTFANIPVKIHWTFIILLIYVASYAFAHGADWRAIIVVVCFILTLFLCVLLHEFGHALTAKRYGIETEDIILLPIGGVARLRNLPDKPKQELIIAIMGPMVNVVIAIILFFALPFTFEDFYYIFTHIKEIDLTSWLGYLILLLQANITLVLFNMIPAFPMDGGRVFRALLAMQLGRLKATKIASIVGQVICVILIAIGVYSSNYILAIIGVFIFFSATQEYRSVALDIAIRDKHISDCYRKDFHSFTEYTSVKEAFDFLLHRRERAFPVINLLGQFSGTITSRQIQLALKTNPETRISEIYNNRLLSLNSSTSLIHAMYALRSQTDLILVTEADQVIGVLDIDAIQQFIELQS